MAKRTRRVNISAETGRFVSKDYAKNNPSTTVAMTIDVAPPKPKTNPVNPSDTSSDHEALPEPEPEPSSPETNRDFYFLLIGVGLVSFFGALLFLRFV